MRFYNFFPLSHKLSFTLNQRLRLEWKKRTLCHQNKLKRQQIMLLMFNGIQVSSRFKSISILHNFLTFHGKVYSKLLPEIHISTLCQMQCIEISILKKIYLKQNKKGYDTTLKWFYQRILMKMLLMGEFLCILKK